jgi:hypothetical protein
MKKADDPLCEFGEYGDLMSNEKASFVPFLCDLILGEMKSKDDPQNNWFPRKLCGDSNLIFICGGKRVCAAIGENDDIRISSYVTMKRWDLECMMRLVVNQGEGERMMFTVVHRLISYCFQKKADSPMDAVFYLHSDDSDVIAGMSMPYVSALHKTCLGTSSYVFSGSIVVRGPDKYVKTLMKLRSKLKEDLGIDQNNNTGDGLIFLIDIVALFYRYRTLEDFQHIPLDSRPCLIPACFAFMNSDYMMPLNGLNYTHFFNAAKSEQFKYTTFKLGNDACSPVIIDSVDITKVIDGDNATCLNLSGIVLIFTIMMSSRTKTKNRMLRSLSEDQYKRFISNNGNQSYDIIRAFSLAAAEIYAVPDKISLIARISCAQTSFRHWSYCIFEESVTPPVDESELVGTFWKICDEGINKKCEILYDLTHLWNKDIKKGMLTNGVGEKWNNSVWELVRKSSHHTYPFQERYLRSDEQITFDAFRAISDTFLDRGRMCAERIDGKQLIPVMEATSPKALKALLEIHTAPNAYTNETQRCKMLKDIFTLTITSVTKYKLPGAGKPQLKTYNPSVVSTGGYKDGDSFERKMNWPEGTNDLEEKPIKAILDMLNSTRKNDAVLILQSLSEHVLNAAGCGDETDRTALSIEVDDGGSVEYVTVDIHADADDEEILNFEDIDNSEIVDDKSDNEDDDNDSVATIDLIEISK